MPVMNSVTSPGNTKIQQQKRARVLLVITKADVGGAQVHVLQILRELGGHFEFILVTGEEGFLTRRARALGVQVLICHQLVRPIRPLKDLSAIVALIRLIRDHRPAFVHTHSFKAGAGRLLLAFHEASSCWD
ncbi:MAG: glycosyltransferase [Gammaproteobacteria bacterium]